MIKSKSTLFLLLPALITGILWCVCTSCQLALERRIIFSGNRSTALKIAANTSFDLDTKLTAAAKFDTPLITLHSKDGSAAMQLVSRKSSVGGKEQWQTELLCGASRIATSASPFNIDNKTGSADIRISLNGNKAVLAQRENCAVFINSFRKHTIFDVSLPEISAITLDPECVSTVKIYPAEFQYKTAKFLKFAGMLCSFLFFSFAGSGILCVLRGRREEKKSRNSCFDIFTGAAVVTAITGTVWAFLEITPHIPDLSQLLLAPENLYPEPEEKLLYILVLLLSAAVPLFICKLTRSSDIHYWNSTAESGSIVLLTAIAGRLIMQETPTISVIVLLVLCIAVSLYILNRKTLHRHLTLVPCFAFAIYCMLEFKVLMLRSMDFFDAHHYSVVLHPIWMMSGGFSPFENLTTYGAYAFFAYPFFRVAGLSPITADIFWFGLTAASFALLYGALKEMIPDRFWGWSTVTAIAGLYCISGTPAHYVQYMPLRVIFPALMLYLLARFRESVLKWHKCMTISATAAASVIWNPDSGTVLIIAWSIYLIFNIIIEGKKAEFLKMLSVPAGAAAVAGTTAVIHLVCYGTLPALHNLLLMPAIFGKFGMLQLPMPYAGAWIIPAVICFSALTFCLRKLVLGNANQDDALLLFTAVLGFGLAGYYVGRSHINNLYLVCYPAVIICGIACCRIPRGKLDGIRFTAAVLLMFAGWCGVVNSSRAFRHNPEQKAFGIYSSRLCNNIEKHLPKSKKLVYTGALEALTAIEIGAVPAFSHPAAEEMLFKSDCEKYCHTLEKGGLSCLHIANTGWIQKFSSEFFRKSMLKQLTKQLNAPVPENTVLLFYK